MLLWQTSRRLLAASRSTSFTARFISTSSAPSAPSHDGSSVRPPRLVEDSTSAIDYKFSQRRSRPPPLPASSVPRNLSAEEAVTNILYNTPPPSDEPYKNHILNCLVQNEPGVLSRISGILAARGFNIETLVVCRTEIRDLSRMCIAISGQDGVVEQARRQLEDLVPVWAVLDYTNTPMITRELLLVKVSILGPEYLEDQLVGGPSHEPQRHDPSSLGEEEVKQENQKHHKEVLAQSFKRSGAPFNPQPTLDPSGPIPLTHSQALKLRSDYMAAINTLAQQFNAKIVDVSENSVIVEMSGKTRRVEAFLKLIRPFGILESARTGVMAMPRTPIKSPVDDEDEEEVNVVDASLLPPG